FLGTRPAGDDGPWSWAWGMVIASSFTVPIGLDLTGRGMLSPAVLPMGFAVAILSSAFPYTLEMIALRQLATKTFGTLMSLEPAIAALAGLVFLSERVTATQSFAIGAAVIALVGTGRENHRPAAQCVYGRAPGQSRAGVAAGSISSPKMPFSHGRA